MTGPARTPAALTGHTGRTDTGHRGTLVLLLARRARRRNPSATVWRLVAYDPATRTPTGDIGQRWQPADTIPASAASRAGAVPGPVAAWVTTTLGPGTAVGAPADAYAGSHSWHITTTDPAGQEAPMPC